MRYFNLPKMTHFNLPKMEVLQFPENEIFQSPENRKFKSSETAIVQITYFSGNIICRKQSISISRKWNVYLKNLANSRKSIFCKKRHFIEKIFKIWQCTPELYSNDRNLLSLKHALTSNTFRSQIFKKHSAAQEKVSCRISAAFCKFSSFTYLITLFFTAHEAFYQFLWAVISRKMKC